MYDLRQLQYLNEQAHLRAIQLANEGIERDNISQNPRQPVFPLLDLANLLITGPVALSNLVEMFENTDVVVEFRQLVREYLPDQEAFIMAQDDDGRIREFKYYFDQRYFPLSDNLLLGEYTLGDFIRAIPVDLYGFTYEDYIGFADFRPGFILMLSLVENPAGELGERLPILEKTAELVGLDTAGMIKEEGWTPQEIHQMLVGTDYSGVAVFADWVHSSTGYMVLDANYVDYGDEDWERSLVNRLAVEWSEAQSLQNKIFEMYDYLEEDTHHRFRELLILMTGRKELIIPKEQMAFPLDENAQIFEKEVITGVDN